MGSVHGGHQHRRRDAETEEERVDGHAETHGDDEAQKAQHEGAPLDALHVLQVHLEAGEKHDVVEPHLAEELKAPVALEHAEAVGADEYARENHAHNRRDVEALQHHRRKEDDGQHGEENPCGVGDWHGRGDLG